VPSPFPGMDPFIESQMWEDFHTDFITVLRQELVSKVRPQYTVNVERYVYVTREHQVESIVAPDAMVADTGAGWRESAVSPAATLQPVKHQIVMPQLRQPYLVIRTRRGETVVSVIELLSPWNKKKDAGVGEYLAKRANVLKSTANLVELDLLRGGQRLPTVDPLQQGDYYAFISRPSVRPDVDVYAWRLQDPLPTLPFPLAEHEPDVDIDLQAAFSTTYDRAGYDYSLHYEDEVLPPLEEDKITWMDNCLKSARPR